MPRRPPPLTGLTGKRIKTSIAVREDLWKDVKIAALMDGEQVQDLIARLLEAYLKARGRRTKRRSHGR